MKPVMYCMNNTQVVVLEGELDSHQVEDLRNEFELLSRATTNVLVDMSEVYFIDSSGIGALVFLFKRLSERGLTLSVLNVRGQPKELFELLHLNKNLVCYDTIRDFLGEDKAASANERVA